MVNLPSSPVGAPKTSPGGSAGPGGGGRLERNIHAAGGSVCVVTQNRAGDGTSITLLWCCGNGYSKRECQGNSTERLHKTPVRSIIVRPPSEPRHFREIEIPHLHRRDHHVERLFP